MYNFKFYLTDTSIGKVLETDYTPENLTAVNSLITRGAYCPAVKRVITSTKTTKSVPVLDADGKPVLDKNNNPKYKRVNLDKPIYTTVVEFEDGSKSIVQCSAHDTPNTETAIVNAIVKRVLGQPNRFTGIVDGHGTGTYLRKLAESAYDQQFEARKAKETKEKAKAYHEDIQAKAHQEAHDRKINKLAKEISNYVEALEKLGYVTKIPDAEQPNEKPCSCSCDKKPTTDPCDMKPTTDSKTFSDLPKAPVKSESKPYVRPNKKFSEFTTAEKREYWRAQKRGFLK